MSGCQTRTKQKKEANGKLFVVATTGPVYDALKNIGGEHIYLVPPLCGPGNSPHTYSLSPDDIRLLNQADLVFYSGLHLESLMEHALDQLSDKSIALSRFIPQDSLIVSKTGHDGHHHHNINPHIWLDPLLWQFAVDGIAENLAKHDSVHAQYYRDNARAYNQQIDSLHSWALKEFEAISDSQRYLITTHSAFAYFAQRYRFVNLTLLGLSTENKLSIKNLSDLADTIVEQEIPVVFIEHDVNAKLIKALVEAVEDRNHPLLVFEKPLYTGSLGTQAPTNTYLGMLKHNISTIVQAFKQ